jgi:hypothetical protein
MSPLALELAQIWWRSADDNVPQGLLVQRTIRHVLLLLLLRRGARERVFAADYLFPLPPVSLSNFASDSVVAQDAKKPTFVILPSPAAVAATAAVVVGCAPPPSSVDDGGGAVGPASMLLMQAAEFQTLLLSL